MWYICNWHTPSCPPWEKRNHHRVSYSVQCSRLPCKVEETTPKPFSISWTPGALPPWRCLTSLVTPCQGNWCWSHIIYQFCLYQRGCVSQIQEFLKMMSPFGDRVRCSVILEGFRVQLFLLCVERGQLRWFRHSIRPEPLGCLPREVFQAHPSGRRPQTDRGLGGEIIFPNKSWLMCTGKGKSGVPCWICYTMTQLSMSSWRWLDGVISATQKIYAIYLYTVWGWTSGICH